MRVAISLSATGGPWGDFVTYAQEAERLGAAICFVAEAWGTDAVSPLAYQRPRRNVSSWPVALCRLAPARLSPQAQTAITLATLSGNRFILGLGVSGSAGSRGLTWCALRPSLRRMRETIHIVRLVCAGEPHCLSGQALRAAASGGEGKALRLNLPPNSTLPSIVASSPLLDHGELATVDAVWSLGAD